jgi:hypothetical protein
MLHTVATSVIAATAVCPMKCVSANGTSPSTRNPLPTPAPNARLHLQQEHERRIGVIDALTHPSGPGRRLLRQLASLAG